MKAMMIKSLCDLNLTKEPLVPVDLEMPRPGPGQILIKVSACGVCHTEIDEIEGRTAPVLPVIPGHQAVGRVVENGEGAKRFEPGDRVGVAWIFHACGRCGYCMRGDENLCADFKGTGRDVNGGYAEYMTAYEDFAVRIPDGPADHEAAPLLCAGAIGYRSVMLANIKDGDSVGLSGFGASAHLVIRLIRHVYPGSRVFVFARNPEARRFAMDLGASWAGDFEKRPPESLDAVIDTTPVIKPLLSSLEYLAPGGRLVINAIRKEKADMNELLSFSYTRHLWMEKEIKSVANVTRKDVEEFLRLAVEIPILPKTVVYPLKEANRAIMDIREGRKRGAKVLLMD